MDSKLSASMAALRKVVKSPHPAMFWQEPWGTSLWSWITCRN